MYITRHIAKAIKENMKFVPVLLLTGGRQTGKTTVLRNTFSKMNYVSLDDDVELVRMQGDVQGYLKTLDLPVILDEIQRCPKAFVGLKLIGDMLQKKGLFLLTGSQKFALMKGVSDSLVGRIFIFELMGLSNRELDKDAFRKPFVPTESYLGHRKSVVDLTNKNLWQRIHRGMFPALWTRPEVPWKKYYANYLRTYLERDVRELTQVGDLLSFQKFMVALAARTGSLLNVAELSRDVGIDVKTAKKWLSILEASNVVYLLQPYSNNITKRVVKTSKVYFADTGLVCYLCDWLTAASAEKGAQSGALYETFVINEIIKSYRNAGEEERLFFFRDSNGCEVDVLIQQDNVLYPLEIKKTYSPNLQDAKHFASFKKAVQGVEIGDGGIICNYDKCVPLGEGIRVIPLTYI